MAEMRATAFLDSTAPPQTNATSFPVESAVTQRRGSCAANAFHQKSLHHFTTRAN